MCDMMHIPALSPDLQSGLDSKLYEGVGERKRTCLFAFNRAGFAFAATRGAQQDAGRRESQGTHHGNN